LIDLARTSEAGRLLIRSSTPNDATAAACALRQPPAAESLAVNYLGDQY